MACGAMGSILFLMLSFGSVFVYEKTSPWLFELLGGPVSSEDDLYEQALMQSDSIMPWDAREMIAEKNAADAVSDEGAGGTEEPAAAQDPDAASGVGETLLASWSRPVNRIRRDLRRAAVMALAAETSRGTCLRVASTSGKRLSRCGRLRPS